MSSGICLGQTAAHSPMLVQPPKPSASCCATIVLTRLYRSGCPCGSIARWVIFAAVNSMPDPLGQAATHAPQPMQVAASNARSAWIFGAGTEWASGADPALMEMKPPAWMMRSNAVRSTTRSLMTGNAPARHGSTSMVAPSAKERMCSWQVVVGTGELARPWAAPLITMPHMPQMPSRQSWSNAMGSSPLTVRSSFNRSSISRNDMSSDTPSTR